jgi:hypothetical protein
MARAIASGLAPFVPPFTFTVISVLLLSVTELTDDAAGNVGMAVLPAPRGVIGKFTMLLPGDKMPGNGDMLAALFDKPGNGNTFDAVFPAVVWLSSSPPNRLPMPLPMPLMPLYANEMPLYPPTNDSNLPSGPVAFDARSTSMPI